MVDVMDTKISDVVSEVNRFKDEVMYESELASAFHCFITHSAGDEEKKFKRHQQSLKNLFSSFKKEEIGPALAHYASILGSTSSNQKLRVLFALLEYGVKDNFIPARLVCESLVKSEFLVYTNEDFWCMSFVLIDRIISSVDYKSIRDILKCILDKANSVKTSVNVAVLNQLRAVQKVLDTVFDRNNCLLPSYLILNELQKKLLIKGCPHWKYSKLVSSFVDSFRPTAQMVSLSVMMNIRGEDSAYGKSKLLPVVGHSATLGYTVWKVDKEYGRGALPYSKDLLEPQPSLLRYVLEQPGSRDMVFNMLGVSSVQNILLCPMFIQQFCEIIMSAMEKSENEESFEYGSPLQLEWQKVATQLLNFGQYEFKIIIDIINTLCEKLAVSNLRKGRDHLMWILLFFISGGIMKRCVAEFLPVLKLYDLLYPEKEQLPVPDHTKFNCTHKLAAVCIWIHLLQKSQDENRPFIRKLPVALTAHAEFVQKLPEISQRDYSDLSHSLHTDYRVPILCNAYSTNKGCFRIPMTVLLEAVHSPNLSQNSKPKAIPGPFKPLSMILLDSLSTQTKMSLIHTFSTTLVKKDQNSVAPALAETYSRLLSYPEIEAYGLKILITNIFPNFFCNHATGIVQVLLEILSYRLHHLPSQYRVQFLNQINHFLTNSSSFHIQLYLSLESTALKLISGFNSADVKTQLPEQTNENQRKLSFESEELTKVLVLTIARAVHITGSQYVDRTWCKEILSHIMQHTPHSWSSSALKCFPKVLGEFFQTHPKPNEKPQLKRSVEEEYRKWKTMSNENDIINHFSLQESSPLFLCLLWKMLLDNDHITTKAYKILDRIGPRSLSAHLRTFADFLVFEFSCCPGGLIVNKYIDALNDLVWKCHVIQLDRLILCLALRTLEVKEAQVCFLIIKLLLTRPKEFKTRVQDFVKNSPEHWKQSDWHDRHLAFQLMYEEKFYFEGLRDLNSQSSQHTYLPVCFGNVCLRFLPVLDIVIHRAIELPNVPTVETLLDFYGCLYKFHDRPLTYLYHTLHYYEQNLKDYPLLKKKLVSEIIGSLKDIRQEGWSLSEGFQNYVEDTSTELDWIPDLDYYILLIERLVDTIAGKSPFPAVDWRFYEFPNMAAHALHVTCIELMAIPNSPEIVGNSLLDVVMKITHIIPSNIVAWMNAVGLVITSLPEAFWEVFYNRILNILKSPLIANNVQGRDPFMMFDFATSYNSMTEYPCTYMIGLAHSIWYHASLGQLCNISLLLQEKLKPAVKTEEQFLYILHLIGPFYQRIFVERTIVAVEIALELYEMLELVDKNCEELKYIDTVCDFLYYIKYVFIGDAIDNEIDRCIRNLRPTVQRKLRFITRQNTEEEAAS